MCADQDVTATQVADAVQHAVLGAVWVEDGGEYARQDRRFQYLVDAGLEPGPWVAIERDLVDVAQIPSGPNRQDLVQVYEALTQVGELEPVVRAVLGPVFDPATLPPGVMVEVDTDDHTVVRAVVEGTRPWDPALGGTGVPGEIERVFTLYVRRAPWRDRAVRRLARVVVACIEIHPDPVESTL